MTQSSKILTNILRSVIFFMERSVILEGVYFVGVVNNLHFS
jgi:hypothetical protein